MKFPEPENGSNFKIRKLLFNEITFVLAIASAVFWVFNYINNPQHKTELDIQSIRAEIESHEKLSDQITNLKDNDMHTIELKLDTVVDSISTLREEVAAEKALLDLLISERDKN